MAEDVLTTSKTFDVQIDSPKAAEIVIGSPMDNGGIISITENGKHVVSGYDLAEVDVQPLPPQTKEVTITENGTTEVTPDEGRLMDKVVVKTDTTKANLTEFINNGGTLAAYKGTEMPEVDWDKVTITNAKEFFAHSNIINYACKLLTATDATTMFLTISSDVKSIDIEIPNVTNATQFLGTAGRPSMQSIIVRRFGEIDRGISGHFVLSHFINLTHDSLIELFENLGTRSGKYYQPPIQLGEANYNKLTEDEIKIATDKGWTVTQ